MSFVWQWIQCWFKANKCSNPDPNFSLLNLLEFLYLVHKCLVNSMALFLICFGSLALVTLVKYVIQSSLELEWKQAFTRHLYKYESWKFGGKDLCSPSRVIIFYYLFLYKWFMLDLQLTKPKTKVTKMSYCAFVVPLSFLKFIFYFTYIVL